MAVEKPHAEQNPLVQTPIAAMNYPVKDDPTTPKRLIPSITRRNQHQCHWTAESLASPTSV